MRAIPLKLESQIEKGLNVSIENKSQAITRHNFEIEPRPFVLQLKNAVDREGQGRTGLGSNLWQYSNRKKHSKRENKKAKKLLFFFPI